MHRFLLAAAVAGALVGPARAATALAQLRYTPDITVSLGGSTVGPADVASDNLAGTVSVVLPALPANLAAYHYTGSAHWLVFETTVALPGGIIATPRDIVAWNGSAYSLLFDGAAAGIPAGVAIDALATLTGSDYLLSFDTTAIVGAMTVAPADVVLHNGSWSSHFSAAAAGVPAGANLDALDRLSNGHLLVSFDVSGTVGGVSFNDEDVLEFTPGANTWELVYNGATTHPAWASADLKTLWAQAGVAGTPPVMGDVPNQNATVGTAFSLALAGFVTPTEGDPITAYAIASGALPPGLTLNTSTGVISGTPSAPGTYNLTVTASDKDGASNADAIQFIVAAAPPIGTPPVMGNVPDQSATVGSAFSLALAGYVTLTEGDPITGYAIASGALPPGLTLNTTTGVSSGTPSAPGTYNVTVTASDKDGASNADAIQFVVAAAVGPNGSPTPVPTLSGWGTMLLSLLLAGLALRRKRH